MKSLKKEPSFTVVIKAYKKKPHPEMRPFQITKITNKKLFTINQLADAFSC